MQELSPLFEEFDAVSKQEWLDKIEKDLKGRPLEELNWVLSEELNFSPFAHAEDLSEKRNPMIVHPAGNNWTIGEMHTIGDLPVTNKELLDGLQNGVEALRLQVSELLTASDLERLFEGIEHRYIETHFSLTESVANRAFLEQLTTYLSARYESGEFPKGSVQTAHPLSADDLQWAMAQASLQQFQLLTIDVRPFYQGPEQVVEELAAAVRAGVNQLDHLAEAGVEHAAVHPHLHFQFDLGTSYFIDLCKLRAFRLLWANVQKAYGLTDQPSPIIEAHLAPSSQTDDPNTNMIHATTQAMSAVLGGANRLFVLPSDAVTGESTAFGRRIARNVQHILKMESYLDRVADPAAGSYYLEGVTERLAELAWGKVQS
jgi:methylmalonyl-CoA mutase